MTLWVRPLMVNRTSTKFNGDGHNDRGKIYGFSVPCDLATPRDQRVG